MPPVSSPDAPVAEVAALLAEPARATMLLALADGRVLPAGELARRARIAPSTASVHLSKLLDGRLLAVEREGKHRYYRLADPERTVRLLEALATLAPAPREPTPAEWAFVASAIRRGRTCYDHFAGVLGVELARGMEKRGWLLREGRRFDVTPLGEQGLAAIGVDVEAARRARRSFARACLDWSERRYHLAGALGTALCERCFALGWVERAEASRVVRVTTVWSPSAATAARDRGVLSCVRADRSQEQADAPPACGPTHSADA